MKVQTLKTDNNLKTSHIFLYIFLLLPILIMLFSYSQMYGILMLIGWGFGLVHRLSTKYDVKLEMQSIKSFKESLPDMNIFHIILFILIAFPTIWFSIYWMSHSF